MNIQNAINAYGNGGPKTSNGAALEEALKKIGAPVKGAKETAFKGSLEAAFENQEVGDSALQSELYTKNVGNEESILEKADNRTDAEKNQERLEDTSDRMTADDMEMLINEGFDIFSMTAEAMQAALDRIKMQKEMFAEAQAGQIEDMENRQAAIIAQAVAALPNNPNAERIAEKLIKANLPLTKANMERVAEAIQLSGPDTRVSKDEAEYLIRNRLAPTLENIAEARTAYSSLNKKERPLSEDAWKQLEPTVTHLLFQAGLKNNREMNAAAQDFIKKDIPLTAENLKAYAQITKIKLGDEDILTKACDAISVGQDPKQMNLLSASAQQVRSIVQNTGKVSDTAVNVAVAQNMERTGAKTANDVNLSLSDLHKAQDEVDNHSPEASRLLEDFSGSGVGQAASIRARRQLEEIKAKMTFEAAFRLEKEGIRIDTVSMNRLIDSLKVLENRFFSDFFTQAGIAKGQYTEEDLSLLKQTTDILEGIKEMPATLIYTTVDKADSITMNQLNTQGQEFKNSNFNRFSHTFETVMTSPDKKYGDSFTKAVQNVDSLIKQNDIEVNEATRRAARILGYAEAEINRENLGKVAAYDEKLQSVLKELHPAVTVRMIRDGINPLEKNLDELLDKITDLKEQEGIKNDDSYSNFLVNLESRKNLSKDEREAYVAIYKALHQIEDKEEMAVGGIFKRGEEPTLKGLLTAVRTGKAIGSDNFINDTFSNLAKLSTDVDRIENKIKAGLGSSQGPDAELLNNLTESADKEVKAMSTDYHRTAEEWVRDLQDIAANGENATRFLEDFNIITTMENIAAAKDLLAGNTDIFKDWKRFMRMDTGEEAELPDFTEALESKESMEKAYGDFADTTKALKSTLQRDSAVSRLDIKALKRMDSSVRFMNRLSKREFYQIPVDTGEDIVNMSVTVLSNEEAALSKVMVNIPTAHLGTVSLDASLEDNKLKCFIKSTTKEGMTLLKDRQLNLFADFAGRGIEIGSIYYGAEEVAAEKYSYQTEGIYKDSQGSATTTSSSATLYRVAKTFVLHVSQADRQN